MNEERRTIDTGGPAFPLPLGTANMAEPSESGGMALRDYFAAKALPAIYIEAMQEAREGSGLFSHEDWRVGLALDAYTMADAMLKARGAA
jgi:hypothetical protein